MEYDMRVAPIHRQDHGYRRSSEEIEDTIAYAEQPERAE